MSPIATFSSFSGSEFLNYFALFYGCDKLSVEEATILKVSTQLDSPVSQVQALKDLGNNLFRQQQFGDAGGCYDTACRLLCLSLKDKIELDLHSISSLAVSLCLNLAACANKLQGFEESLIYCSMVLHFFPCNAKALFRKAVALKKLNRFSEALTSLEEASLTEPRNKDIIQELEDVRQSLAVNKNGKRVLIDSLNANDVRAGKVLVSHSPRQEVGSPFQCKDTAMVELQNEASCSSSQLGAGCEHMAHPDCVLVPSPEVYVPNDTMTDSEANQSSSSNNSTSSHLRFTNKKRPHTALNISSQDYENLLNGKNLGFYHPRSMSFMRVRTLTSKTIRTGTPHEVLSGSAEVPITSPLQENLVTPLTATLSSVELVREEVIEVDMQSMKVDNDTVALDPAQVQRVSAVHFQFVAVKENAYSLTRTCRRRVAYSYRRRYMTQASLHMRKRSSVSLAFSLCLCRYTKEYAGIKRAKGTGTDLFDFDGLYPPYKKRRLAFSVSNSCNVSPVCWLSSSLQNSAFRRFVV